MRTHNIDAARDLRQRQTLAEARAWALLRDRRLKGVKFRRQHAIGPWVVDFSCASLRLVIELDGAVHNSQLEDDAVRQQELELLGYNFLRFTNEDVLERHDDFVEAVLMALQRLAS